MHDATQVSRAVFLGYLANQRARYGEGTRSQENVNLVATLLSDFKLEGLLPDLPSDIYLRAKENRTKVHRLPRPWPVDVLARVESQIINDPDLDPQFRLMVKFCRYSGPRVSELVNLPIDSLIENGKGGYWIEYWMDKVDRWRRFPIPASLGSELAATALSVRATFGESAIHMFPSPTRSNKRTGVTRPWSATGFGRTLDEAFKARGIERSSMTGESVAGGQVHRFRHSIGTELLNNGWTQQEVQKFLGHSSPTMTAAYAEILDDTLNRRADEFHRMLERDRARQRLPYSDPVVERLRERYSAVLPLGRCTLPASQTCSARSNPCLTCTFFSKGSDDDAVARRRYESALEQALSSGQFEDDPQASAINQRLLRELKELEDS